MEQEFILYTSLPWGVGSNDIGLDRNQLGRERLVSFTRSGPRVLLIEKNTNFRGVTTDAREARGVEESFARSATAEAGAEQRIAYDTLREWAQRTRASIPDFLEQMDRLAHAKQLHQSGGDVVLLQTIHQAKGGQWPLVVVSGLEHGAWPSQRSLIEDDARRVAVEQRAEGRRIGAVERDVHPALHQRKADHPERRGPCGEARHDQHRQQELGIGAEREIRGGRTDRGRAGGRANNYKSATITSQVVSRTLSFFITLTKGGLWATWDVPL
jgi:hypothetical protein